MLLAMVFAGIDRFITEMDFTGLMRFVTELLSDFSSKLNKKSRNVFRLIQ